MQRSEYGCSRVWEGKCIKKAEGHSRLHTYPSQRTLGEGNYEGRFDREGIWDGSGVPVMCSVGGCGSWYNLFLSQELNSLGKQKWCSKWALNHPRTNDMEISLFVSAHPCVKG